MGLFRKKEKVLEGELTGKKVVNKSGQRFEVVLIPEDEANDYRSGSKNIALRDKIQAKLRPHYKHQTSDADDESTTDTAAYTQLYGGGMVAKAYYDLMREQEERRAVYDELHRMDKECVYAERALDVTVASVFTSAEGDQESWKITSPQPRVQTVLEEFDRRLSMHDWMPQAVRDTLLSGDGFVEPVVDDASTVVRLKWLWPKYMVRQEDQFGRIDAEAAFTMEDEAGEVHATWQFWQCIHVRYNHRLRSRYGTSFYRPARRPWRQYGLMDDGVIIARLSRSGKRYLHKIPMNPNTPPDEKDRLIEEAIEKFKRARLTDDSGNIDLRKRPPIEDDDIFIPVWENSNADVQVLDPGGRQDNYDDMRMKRDEIIMALGVPKAYLGIDDEVRGRAHLGWQDIDYARRLRAIQKMSVGQLQRRLYNLELYLQGILPQHDTYTIIYPPISFVDERMKLEVLRMRWEIALMARMEMGIPVRWVLTNLVGLGETEIEEIFGDDDFVNVPPGPQQQAFGQREQRLTRDAVFGQMRVMDELQDLRGKLRVVAKEGLNRSLEMDPWGKEVQQR